MAIEKQLPVGENCNDSTLLLLHWESFTINFLAKSQMVTRVLGLRVLEHGSLHMTIHRPLGVKGWYLPLCQVADTTF